MDEPSIADLQAKIHELEEQLEHARFHVTSHAGANYGKEKNQTELLSSGVPCELKKVTKLDGLQTPLPFPTSLHSTFLLADSALPLGSFAFSSGLESFLAHHKLPSGLYSSTTLFQKFLSLSIESIAFSNIPYLLASYRVPEDLAILDNDLDASILCTVARRASQRQGTALMMVWERCFASSASNRELGCQAGASAIHNFNQCIKKETLRHEPHLAPLWGALCLALGLEVYLTAYLFLFNHAKAVLSAAVRREVIGPYQAQAELAGESLRILLSSCLNRVWNLEPEDACQTVPAMDLWIGRHELLYSRIFNS
jgi:urease accessory protein